MSPRLDYRIVNFLLACVGGAVAVYVAVAIPPPHTPGAPLLIPLDRSPAPMVVYVTGAVRRPGLYQVRPDGRLYAAIEAAGGLTAQARSEGLNLARRLKDEEMVVVPSVSSSSSALSSEARPPGGTYPRPGEVTDTNPRLSASDVPAPSSTVAPLATATDSLADTASAADLGRLPGMTTILAQTLVRYREEHGPLLHAEELRRIPGFKRRWRRLGSTLGLVPCPPASAAASPGDMGHPDRPRRPRTTSRDN